MTQAIVKKGGVLNQPVGNKDNLEALIAGPNFQAAIASVLPDHIKLERIMKMVLIAASRQPKIFDCTQGSIMQSLMRSAELGLDCSGALGLAYLVPYWNSSLGANECQLIVGYRGIIELAKRANPKMQIEARVVYANDEFEFEYGLEPKLVHRPTMGIRGEIVYVYCISREPGLKPEFSVMNREEIDAIKGRSSSKSRTGQIVGPWVTDYSEMARKTITKRHAKYLALSVEVQDAISADDEQYRGHRLAIAGDVSQNVGLGAMKNRLNLVQQDPDPDPNAPQNPTQPIDPNQPGQPQPEPPLPQDPNQPQDPAEIPTPPDSGPDEAVGPEDDEEAAERAAIQAEPTTANADIEKLEKEREQGELKIFALRKTALDRFRELEHEDIDAYVAANKWLGSKSITQLTENKLNDFLKQFG